LTPPSSLLLLSRRAVDSSDADFVSSLQRHLDWLKVCVEILSLPPAVLSLSLLPLHIFLPSLSRPAHVRTTAKTYSPLFVKTFVSQHKLATSYKSINRRRTQRITGKVTKPAALRPRKNKKAMAQLGAPSPGIENMPPDMPFRVNLNNRVMCPDCRENPPNIVEEGAEMLCGSCGLVLQDRLISSESEWRTFNSDDSRGADPNRVGDADNDLLTGSNVGTQIGGHFGSGATRKLQMTQSKLQGNKQDSKLQQGYARIQTWAETLKIPPGTSQLAKRYYMSVAESPAFRGKNMDAVLAGCLFIACRQHKVPRSFAEIFGTTSVPKKEIGRMYKQLERHLKHLADDQIEHLKNQGLSTAGSGYTGTKTTRPQDMVERICNQLGLKPRSIVQYAIHLAKETAGIQDLAGRSPLSTASACIYMAAHLVGEPRSYKDISKFANVSDATIKQAYKKLYEARADVVLSTWTKPDGSPVNMDQLPPS
ncbi:hypothetical protein DV735_g742, partial [Chaetothyriales sp. CBS 134920]